jgi:hypothetical protein
MTGFMEVITKLKEVKVLDNDHAELKFNMLKSYFMLQYKKLFELCVLKSLQLMFNLKGELSNQTSRAEFENKAEGNESKIRLHSKFQTQQQEILVNFVENCSKFVEGFESTKFTQVIKLCLYAVLKTEGDILIELGQYDLAIKCFKTLKDQCDIWGGMREL